MEDRKVRLRYSDYNSIRYLIIEEIEREAERLVNLKSTAKECVYEKSYSMGTQYIFDLCHTLDRVAAVFEGEYYDEEAEIIEAFKLIGIDIE